MSNRYLFCSKTQKKLKTILANNWELSFEELLLFLDITILGNPYQINQDLQPTEARKEQ